MKKKKKSVTNGGQRALCLSGWTPEDEKQLLGSDGTWQVKPVKWMRLCNSDISVVKVHNFLSLKLISSALWPLPECAINDWFFRTLVLQPLVSAGLARGWWQPMNQGGNKTKSLIWKVLEFSKDPLKKSSPPPSTKESSCYHSVNKSTKYLRLNYY